MFEGRDVMRFHIRFELAQAGYTVSVPELPGCITEEETFEEALHMVKDAMASWLYVAAKYGDPIPEQFEALLDELSRRLKGVAKPGEGAVFPR